MDGASQEDSIGVPVTLEDAHAGARKNYVAMGLGQNVGPAKGKPQAVSTETAQQVVEKKPAATRRQVNKLKDQLKALELKMIKPKRVQPKRNETHDLAIKREQDRRQKEEEYRKQREEAKVLRKKITELKKEMAKKAHKQAAQGKQSAADGDYDDATKAKLYAAMTSNCAFCGIKKRSRPEVRNHVLFDCPALQAVPEIDGVLKEMKRKLESRDPDVVLPTTFRWSACPLDGLHYLATLRFPPRVYIAPSNYLYIYMDASDRKGERRLRRSAFAQLFEHGETRKQRKRRYADRHWHLEWEAEMKNLIERGAVDQLLIVVTFWYTKENILLGLDKKNHCALLNLTFSDGKCKATYYDSIDKAVYANAGTSGIVQNSLKHNIIPAGFDFKLTKQKAYKSLNGKGCQGNVAFWIVQALKGLPLTDPPNVESVEAMKGILWNPPVVDENIKGMRGEEFDLEWDFIKRTNNAFEEADDDENLKKYFEQCQKIKNIMLKL